MAVSLSSTVYTTTVSASASSIKEGAHRKSCSLTKQIPFSFTPLSSRPRKLFGVQATVLQEDDKKVAVEESFQPKSICDDDGKGTPGESSESSSSSGLESWVIKLEQSVNVFLTDSVIKILDTLYHDRDYARFFVLETIARVPYFAFISVLHLYESFGWWRRADYLKVHFAESWNEMHHLLIMEELGGNAWWFDRFLAQHIAVFYYFMIVFMYALSPRMAYHFSECVESHAFETYDKFIKAQGEELKKMPAPEVAVKYYTGGDLYLFDEFQTSRVPNSRRPKIVGIPTIAAKKKSVRTTEPPTTELIDGDGKNSAATAKADHDRRTGCTGSQKRASDHRSVLLRTCRKSDEGQRRSGEGCRSCGEGQRRRRWLGQRQTTSKQYGPRRNSMGQPQTTSEQYG